MTHKHTLILAHGAGAPMDSDWMNYIAERFESHGVKVIRFEFPYMQMRRVDGVKRPPNRLPLLLETYQNIIDKHRNPTSKIFIGGKSMGGRIATMVADACDNVIGSIAFGYPFHPPTKPEKLRTEHLQSCDKPCLIIQGTNDPFGKQYEWSGFNLADNVHIYPVADANHDLKPLKRTGLSLEDALDLTVQHAIEFMDTQ